MPRAAKLSISRRVLLEFGMILMPRPISLEIVTYRGEIEIIMAQKGAIEICHEMISTGCARYHGWLH